MTVDLGQIGKIATGVSADDSLRTVRFARSHDEDGFPDVQGESVPLAGERWLVPRRKAAISLRIELGRVKAAEADVDAEEAALIQEVLGGCEAIDADTTVLNGEAVYSLLAYALRLNYDLTDGEITKVLNDDMAKTNDACVRVLELRLQPNEQALLVPVLLAWAKVYTRENGVEVAEAIEEVADGDS